MFQDFQFSQNVQTQIELRLLSSQMWDVCVFSLEIYSETLIEMFVLSISADMRCVHSKIPSLFSGSSSSSFTQREYLDLSASSSDSPLIKHC